MGYSKEQVLLAFNEVAECSENKEISSLWPAVICRLREDQVYGSHPVLQNLREESTSHIFMNGNNFYSWRDVNHLDLFKMCMSFFFI